MIGPIAAVSRKRTPKPVPRCNSDVWCYPGWPRPAPAKTGSCDRSPSWASALPSYSCSATPKHSRAQRRGPPSGSSSATPHVADLLRAFGQSADLTTSAAFATACRAMSRAPAERALRVIPSCPTTKVEVRPTGTSSPTPATPYVRAAARRVAAVTPSPPHHDPTAPTALAGSSLAGPCPRWALPRIRIPWRPVLWRRQSTVCRPNPRPLQPFGSKGRVGPVPSAEAVLRGGTRSYVTSRLIMVAKRRVDPRDVNQCTPHR